MKLRNQYKTVKLGDVANIQNGYAFKSSDYSSTGIPIIKIKNIASGKLNFNDLTYYPMVSESLKPFEVHFGDILISMTGSHISEINSAVGKIARYDSKKISLLNQRVGKIYPNSSDIDNDYLYYVLSRPEVQYYWAKNASGTANQANISPSIIKSYKFSLPPLSEQKRISSILSSFDNKIEQLKKQNNILEDIAQSIFKEWFVKYNFPNKDGKPYKDNNGKMIDSELGLIPEGWRVGKLGEIVKCFDSKRIPLSKEEREQRKGKYPYYGATEIMDYVNEYLFDGKYLLLAEDGSVQTNQGYPVLQLVDGKFWVNNHTHVLQGKEPFSTEYIYLLMKKFNITNIVTGAVQPKINKTNLLSLELLLPDRKLVQNFNKTNTFLFEKIFENSYNITNLTKTKTALLNKLLQ